MAIYDPSLPYPDWPATTGIALRLIPGAIGFGGELQRATVNTGPWTTVMLISKTQLSIGEYLFFDPLANDGSIYYYRARHIRSGWNEGNWTTPIQARARQVRDPYTNQTPGEGGGGGGGGGDDELLLSQYGRVDGQAFTAGITIASGSFVAYSDDLPFRWSDVSKSLEIQGAGAGGVTYFGDIASVETFATVSVSVPAETSVIDVPFRFGTDNSSVLQTLLDLAAQDSTKPNVVKLPAGSFFLSASDSGALRIGNNVTVEGQGDATQLFVGSITQPIFQNSESINRGIVLRDMQLYGAIHFTGVEDFKLQNISVVSSSLDALILSGSSGGVVQSFTAASGALHDVLVQDSRNITLIDLITTGSQDYSVEFINTVSSSLVSVRLSPEGSGTFTGINTTDGNSVFGINEGIVLGGTWDSQLTGSFKVPSRSIAIHDEIDLGALSSSFTISFGDGNAQKFTAGADLTASIDGVVPGAVTTLEIDNSGNHTMSLDSVLWGNGGLADTISSGSNSLVFQGLSIGTFVQIVGKDIQ